MTDPIRLPRSVDFVPQPWKDRLVEKQWRARVFLRTKHGTPRPDFASPVPAFLRPQAD